jgi:hypothetical protein
MGRPPKLPFPAGEQDKQRKDERKSFRNFQES